MAKQHIVVLTGAGISAESGLRTIVTDGQRNNTNKVSLTKISEHEP